MKSDLTSRPEIAHSLGSILGANFVELAKTSARTEDLARTARAAGVSVGEGDWRWLAKMLRKGKIDHPSTAAPTARMKDLAAASADEVGEVGVRGRSRHLVHGDGGTVALRPVSANRTGPSRPTAHSHPGDPPDPAMIERDLAQELRPEPFSPEFEELMAAAGVDLDRPTPGNLRHARRARDVVRGLVSPEVWPSSVDIHGARMPGGAGEWHAIYSPATGKVGYHRVPTPGSQNLRFVAEKTSAVKEARQGPLPPTIPKPKHLQQADRLVTDPAPTQDAWKKYKGRALRSPGFRQAILLHPEADSKLKRHVRAMEGMQGAEHVRRVKSDVGPKRYTLKLMSSGRVGCTCPDWYYKRSHKGSDCKHVRRFKKALDAGMQPRGYKTLLEKEGAVSGFASELARLAPALDPACSALAGFH